MYITGGVGTTGNEGSASLFAAEHFCYAGNMCVLMFIHG